MLEGPIKLRAIMAPPQDDGLAFWDKVVWEPSMSVSHRKLKKLREETDRLRGCLSLHSGLESRATSNLALPTVLQEVVDGACQPSRWGNS